MKISSDLKTLEMFRRIGKVEWELWAFCPQKLVTAGSWSLASKPLAQCNFIYMS